MDINKKRTCVIDVETNGFLEDYLDYSKFPYKFNNQVKVWCIVIRDVDTEQEWFSELNGITKDWLEETLNPFYYIVAHNGIKYDFIFLKLMGLLDYKIGFLEENDIVFGRECRFIDTLILSRLSNPDSLSHSLSYWGKRLGEYKQDYRGECIKHGFIDKNSSKGSEFKSYNPLMLEYCKQDCKVNVKIYKALLNELKHHNWSKAIKMEHKLADLSISREHLGFKFNYKLAKENLQELNSILDDLASKVEPLIPRKTPNKKEQCFYTPPKNQLKKDGSLTSYMINFINRVGATIKSEGFVFNNKFYKIPHQKCLITKVKAEMKDFDHIKQYLIYLGWNPVEWSERDMTKDSNKKNLTYKKRVEVLDRWWEDTINGKYKKYRLENAIESCRLNRNCTPLELYNSLKERLNGKFPVRVYTSPKVKVGVEKELCPNLQKLGDKVAFAKDFSDWLTYRHRRNAIAGGDIVDGKPSSGFLSTFREVDGRIPTPSIEIGAVTGRYTHIGVANIPRPSSLYGDKMRALFEAGGKDECFFGFDYSSLENRIMAHYVHKYPDGVELGKQFVAEKPNDFHTQMSIKMNMPRSEVKSLNYGILYGAKKNKVSKMTNTSLIEADNLINNFWDGASALRDLKNALTYYWQSTDKKNILGIDNRKIKVRSEHALLNSLFQSGGVIFAKYVTVKYAELLTKEGFCISPFEGDPDMCSMIEYHDEQDMYLKVSKLNGFKTFKNKDDAKEFVKNWKGRQLSDIVEGENCFYIALPSTPSIKLEEAVKWASKYLKIKVPMGFGYMIGKNWLQCH